MMKRLTWDVGIWGRTYLKWHHWYPRSSKLLISKQDQKTWATWNFTKWLASFMNTAFIHYRQHLYNTTHSTIHITWDDGVAKSGYIPRVFFAGSLVLAAALIFHTRKCAGTTYAPLLFRSKTTYYIWTQSTLTTFFFISLSWSFLSFTILSVMDITAPQFRNRFIHTRYQALRKCCGCIHLRVGAAISCLIWMVPIAWLYSYLNTYTLTISGVIHVFRHLVISEQKSQVFYIHHEKCYTYISMIAFYSYMTSAPLIVYGVVNLLLALNGFFGMLALFRVRVRWLAPHIIWLILLQNRWFYVRLFSHATWTVLFMVLVDGFANAIYFITQRQDYMSWCINSSADTLNTAANVTGTSLRGNDYYNCDRLFQAEIKFGLFSTILMIVLYVSYSCCGRICIWTNHVHG